MSYYLSSVLYFLFLTSLALFYFTHSLFEDTNLNITCRLGNNYRHFGSVHFFHFQGLSIPTESTVL